MPRNTLTNQTPTTNDEQNVQLHHAWWAQTIDGAPTDGPLMAGYTHGSHIADRIEWGSPMLQGRATLWPRNWMGQSQCRGQGKSQHALHTCFYNQVEGLNSLLPTRASKRHAHEVNATMSITVSREQENVCWLDQLWATLRSKGIVTLQSEVVPKPYL